MSQSLIRDEIAYSGLKLKTLAAAAGGTPMGQCDQNAKEQTKFLTKLNFDSSTFWEGGVGIMEPGIFNGCKPER